MIQDDDRPYRLGSLAASPGLTPRERAIITAAFEDHVASLPPAARGAAEVEFALGEQDPAPNPRAMAHELGIDLSRPPPERERGRINWISPWTPPPDPEPGAGLPPRRPTRHDVRGK